MSDRFASGAGVCSCRSTTQARRCSPRTAARRRNWKTTRPRRAAFPNPQGRLVAAARVFRRGDAFLFDTEPATYERVLRSLERFTLAGDFRVRDLTRETAQLSVQGARASEIVRAALGGSAAET